ncbi:hypothetical protein DZC30_21495 [Comamonas testosteroni]|uniref:Uncharacterized protein n=1 Tax=Comamonas testosteroni TaxID=285 RepID=A0A373F6F6_COMTE|nr:hypothetical protein [Comamonas testosteroni]RGE39736.1 hypothetical protein DZC30_21495 [Comamonas testosteroni]
MTWYADEILLRATPAALTAIKADAQLVGFAYHLKSLDEFDWYLPEHRHGLPAEGLLVVRPVCNAQSHGGRWYGEPVLDAAQLSAATDAQALLNPQIPEQLAADVYDSALPCAALRASLATLAQRLNEPVVYYSCSMWGGDIDHEFCLLYEPQESLLMTDVAERGHGAERALGQGLQKLGLALPTAFFAPHTRSFDWAAHKL